MAQNRKIILVSLFLVFITMVVFGQVIYHDFINYDDNYYVTKNQHVLAGWTLEGIQWAFTTKTHGHWHPLTWLSHMTDCQFFGRTPAGHHLTSLFFHMANVFLLFLVMAKMTGALYRSAFVAALFAIHPLHVEPVVWVAGRKDLLSAFFWLLAMLAYVRYAKQPRIPRYLLVLTAFTMGLMAKPMVVTLPFVLLLVDYWPLGRFAVGKKEAEQDPQRDIDLSPRFQIASPARLFSEKAFPFAMLGASAVATLAVLTSATKATFSLSMLLPSLERLGGSLVFYVVYIGKMFWPARLAVPYPHPEVPSLWQVTGALIVLALVSFLVLYLGRRYPYLPVGWFWYLITLLPVIGLVQIGPYEIADRYTYVPLIGLFIAITWGAMDLSLKWRLPRLVPLLTAGTVLLALMVCSWIQVGYWKNSITVFEHSIKITTGNYKAHNNLGLALEAQGKLAEASSHYSEAVRIRPNYPKSHGNLADVLAKQGKLSEALPHYLETVHLNPKDEKAHHNLGVTLARLGKVDEAITAFFEALRIKPDYLEAHNSLGTAFARQGRLELAVKHFSEALRIKPDYKSARNNLDRALHELRESRGASDKADHPTGSKENR